MIDIIHYINTSGSTLLPIHMHHIKTEGIEQTPSGAITLIIPDELIRHRLWLFIALFTPLWRRDELRLAAPATSIIHEHGVYGQRRKACLMPRSRLTLMSIITSHLGRGAYHPSITEGNPSCSFFFTPDSCQLTCGVYE